MKSGPRWGCAFFLFVAIGAPTKAWEMSLVPVGATGSHVIIGNEIRVTGPQTLIFELQIRDWNPDLLKSFQGQFDAMTLANGHGDPLMIAAVPCTTQEQCTTPFGGGMCFPDVCAAGFINRDRSDWLFDQWEITGDVIADVRTTSVDFLYFGTVAPPFYIIDNGTTKYVGTLLLDVPATAHGVFEIALVENTKLSFLADTADGRIQGESYGRATVVIVCASDEDCDDDNPCTNETCDSEVCTYSPAEAGTACGSTNATECDDPDSCDENGVCVDHVKSIGAVCRVAAGDCDVAEVCDGVSASCPQDVVVPNGEVCPTEDDPCAEDRCIDGECVSFADCSCSGVKMCGDGCCAANAEQVRNCPQDCDDLRGVADLLNCVQIRRPPPLSPCLDYDIDGDGFITLVDYLIYVKRYFGGP